MTPLGIGGDHPQKSHPTLAEQYFLHAAGAVVEAFSNGSQTAASKSIVPHYEKLFIDAVIHQSTVLLAGFLLYFTILGNSFLAKTFLESFFQKCYPVFIGNHNLLFSFHTAITILPNGGIEAMDTTEGLQKYSRRHPACLRSKRAEIHNG